jgi:hypothetical protein
MMTDVPETSYSRHWYDQELSPQEEKIFTSYLIAINKVLPPLVIIVGLIGNLFAFLVLRQPQYAKQTTCFYMKALSVFDSSSLLSHVTIRTIINYHPKLMLGTEAGPIVCPILAVVARVYLLSNWTIAAMTCDRFLAIRFPLQAASWCTMKRCKITVSGIIIVYVCISVANTLRTSNPDGLTVSEICRFDTERFPAGFQGIYTVMVTSVAFTAPFLTTFIFNISIIITLIQERIKTEKENLGSNRGKLSKKDGHITILLFMVTLVFFVTNIPWTLDQWLWRYLLRDNMVTARQTRIRKVAYESTVFILFINSSVNFYFYCLGCRKFRNDMRRIFLTASKKQSM